jgi:hypothetical protein
MVLAWRQLVLAHLSGDRAAFRRRLVELGFFPAEAPLDDGALYDFFGYFYRPFHDDGEFTFTAAYASGSLGHILKPEGRFAPLGKQLNLPRDFVFANRLQFGLYSILAQLGARANFHRIHREYLEQAPPSTELGRLDASHFARLAGRDLALTVDGLRARA